MFSTNVLIVILEWLHDKFDQAARKQAEVAATHLEIIKQRTAMKNEALVESARAQRFADKISNFLE
jgi:hypothetical protein